MGRKKNTIVLIGATGISVTFSLGFHFEFLDSTESGHGGARSNYSSSSAFTLPPASGLPTHVKSVKLLRFNYHFELSSVFTVRSCLFIETMSHYLRT